MDRDGQQPSLDGRRVVVTGAGGFVGRATVAALCAAGARVIAVLRSGHEADHLRSLGAEVRRARLDALPPGLLDGADALVHLAYDVRASAAVNLALFERVVAQAEAAGVGRIVHMSSAVVIDGWPDGDLSETAPWGGPGGGGYRQAKIAMERRLLAGRLPAVILEPTIVYGPGSALWTDAPIARLRQGPVVLPDPPGLCPAVHVTDVARAVVLAVALPDPGRERFVISGPDLPDWASVYRGLARILGAGSVRLVPRAEVEARLGPPGPERPDAPPALAARVSARARRLLGSRRFEALLARLRRLRGGGEVWPDRGLAALYAARPRLDARAARDRLGFVARTGFAQGLDGIRDQYRL